MSLAAIAAGVMRKPGTRGEPRGLNMKPVSCQLYGPVVELDCLKPKYNRNAYFFRCLALKVGSKTLCWICRFHVHGENSALENGIQVGWPS